MEPNGPWSVRTPGVFPCQAATRLPSVAQARGWVSRSLLHSYVKAPMPVMARPTMRVCMVSVPSKVWIASMSTMCRMTW